MLPVTSKCHMLSEIYGGQLVLRTCEILCDHVDPIVMAIQLCVLDQTSELLLPLVLEASPEARTARAGMALRQHMSCLNGWVTSLAPESTRAKVL